MLVLIPSPLYNNKPISLYMVPSTYRNNLQNNLLLQNYEVFHKEHLNSYRIIFHLFVPELSVTACEPLPQLEIFFIFDFNCFLNALSTCHVQCSWVGSQLKAARNAS